MTKFVKDMENYLLDDLEAGLDTTKDIDFLKLFATDTHNHKLYDEIINVINYDGSDVYNYGQKVFGLTDKELQQLP